jgi:hypothetical protein
LLKTRDCDGGEVQGLSREELVAVMMVYATQDPRGVALCPVPIMGWLEGVDGRPLHRGHSTHFEKRQMLAFARLSLIFNMYQVGIACAFHLCFPPCERAHIFVTFQE